MAEVIVPAVIEEVPPVSNAEEVPVGSEEAPVSTEETTLSGKKRKIPLFVIFKDASRVLKKDELGMEILRIAFPAALALTADPIASLIDTAFIGRIGPVELAAVGVSIAVFNQVSRVTIFPLVSITTSFVAEEETVARINADEQETENLEKGLATCKEMKEFDPECDTEKTACQPSSNIVGKSKKSKTKHEKRHIPSASSALVIGGILGLLQTIFLIFASKPVLRFMGVKSGSPMMTPALRYLTLRSLGSPAVLLSLAMQGIFRGFKDTKTPLFATVAGDLTNIILDPVLMFVFHLGVSGAALAHVISQYFIAVILLWRLMKQIELLPPSIKDLQFSRFLKNGFLLLMRVIAVTFCVTLAASMAAREGPTPMAAFQICLQVWLTTSLLADGLAVAGQAILASAFAEKDYEKAKATAARVLQMSLVLGLGLAIFIGLGLYFGAVIFTRDINVIHVIHIGLPFVAASQPLNSLAFVYDGVNFGASDFAFTGYAMVLVAVVSIVCLIFLSSSNGFVGIWIALTIYMSLRALAGCWRMGTGTGPWKFLRS
ncbi:protein DETOXIFICATION 42-like [Macadamia integrifolia]|uniref:protein DETOXIFICATION 42-like n=1 Tax=Macadamia integrifolia TaxID=60698 RepID=UPI001C4F9624|nr:protein DETOXIFICATION 42-like [Macadamia integrifolia]XP_042515450.1 protein DETOXIFICATION 42-like [Macadamia integrifolia]XP_042515452.1 protein DETOXIFICATION 42-like [Macadamia integrifolia]XP_042515453.1 protein DETOXIFICATION 42-like [Macadamia integrifolia]